MPTGYRMTMTINDGCLFVLPGHTLKGSLTFDSTKPCKIKDLKVAIQATAVVDTHCRFFSRSSRTLCVYDVTLLVIPTQQLRQGLHIERFGTTLPDDLPASAAVTGLTLTYRVTVTYSKFFGRGVLADQVIHVLPHLDLSRYPISCVYRQDISRLEWVHQGKDFVYAKLDLPSCSFGIGDRMCAQVTLRNDSENVYITGVVCMLQMVITHKCNRCECMTYVVANGGPDIGEVGPGEKRQGRFDMVLNNLPPTGLLKRADINIDYRIKLEVIPRDDGFPTLTMEVPVIVGTRPSDDGVDIPHDSGPFALCINNPSSAASSGVDSTHFRMSRSSGSARHTRPRTGTNGHQGPSPDESNVTTETTRATEISWTQSWPSGRSTDRSLTKLKTTDVRSHGQSEDAGLLLDNSRRGTYGAMADPGWPEFEHQARFESDTQRLQPKQHQRIKRPRHDS